MSTTSVELPQVNNTEKNDNKEVILEAKEKELEPASLSTLFFSHATKGEIFMMILGYISSIISGILNPVSFIFMGDIMDILNEIPFNEAKAKTTLLWYFIIIFLASFFAFLERFFLGYYAEKVTQHYRSHYIQCLLSHDVSFIEKFSPGKLGQRYAEESSRIVEGLGPSLGFFIRSMASLLTGLIMGFYYSWQLTIYSLIAFPILSYFGFYFGSCMELWAKQTMQEQQEADAISEETFRNIKTVSTLGAEKKFIDRYRKVVEHCRCEAIRILKKSAGGLGMMASSNQLANAILYVSALVLVYNQRSHYPSDLVNAGCPVDSSSSVNICFDAYTTLSDVCKSICDSVNECWFHAGSHCLVGSEVAIIIYAVLNSFMGIGSSFASLTALAKSKMAAAYFLEVIDHEDTLNKDQEGVIPSPSQGDIVFKDISFQYESRDTQVLKNLQLIIHEGEMLGIVGESGSGKSTILKLLMRLYSPSSGTIEWNNKDVTTLSIPWIHDQISYVAQEPVLFSGTIRENIQYGHIGCTEEEMIEAAKLVEADSFIRSFPKGYDTFVGELGNSLSGGQKQRIAIARALLRKPRILVLDEATSALDSQSEEIVQRAIEKIRQDNKKQGGNLSIVIVAHRLSSIRNCDRIVVMDEGHIVEEGTHDSLMQKGGIYSGLYQSQLTSGISVNTPTEESTIQEERKESMKIVSTTTEEKDETIIPDEIDKKDMKHYSVMSLLQFSGPQKWLFWVGVTGSFLRALFPPVYGYCSAVLQSILYTPLLDYFKREGTKLIIPIIITAFCTLFGTLLGWGCHSIVGENIVAYFRNSCYSKLISSSVSFFDDPRHLPSIIVSRLSVDCRRIRDIIDYISPIVENTILGGGAILLIFSPFGNWILAILAIVLSPTLFSSEYFMFMIVVKISEEIDDQLTIRAGTLTDYVLNIHTVHAYNLQKTLADQVINNTRKVDKLTLKRSLRSSIGQLLGNLLPSLFMVILFTIGTFMIIAGSITFTQLFVVIMAVFMCCQFIGINLAYTGSIKLAEQSANNVIALTEAKDENETYREVKIEATNGDIQFKQVSFTYPARLDHPIFKDISFTIPKDSSVAFVGPSGCGKSTIISLIQRLYSPVNGSILLNGQDVKQVNLDSYRTLMGCVNQEPCMFSGTIRENLVMGVDREVSKEELESICKQTLCMEFINEMPDGFETDLGATGKAVSGGQKQRLALARALLRNPQILLLDEATSALDSENQEKFLNALNEWRKSHPCTVITVAHRLSTIVESDIIFVINEGQLIASGKHEELLQNCPFYNNLVRGQMESAN